MIHIHGIPIPLVYEDGLRERTGADSIWRDSRNEVGCDPGLKPYPPRASLSKWHELLHAVADLSGIELTETEIEAISGGFNEAIGDPGWDRLGWG